MPTSVPSAAMQYTPADWYWKASDGRVYASGRNALVYPYDSPYLAFVARWGGCTPWPTDAAGNQTTQALQDVVGQYGIVLPF